MKDHDILLVLHAISELIVLNRTLNPKFNVDDVLNMVSNMIDGIESEDK